MIHLDHQTGIFPVRCSFKAPAVVPRSEAIYLFSIIRLHPKTTSAFCVALASPARFAFHHSLNTSGIQNKLINVQ